ncbi:MAG: hypothetical protein IPI13_15770 [Actinomycetales bacterium]|uniref:Phosphomannomutase n=1 Tax=Candidatus Phosphoribacter hodrii TaxID=2953743 RepID=A0A935MIV4_9MICO|nr:hypothetical protein [Candidatus Phosphoribacter hodrii]
MPRPANQLDGRRRKAATTRCRALEQARAQGPVEIDTLDGTTVRHLAEPMWWFNVRAPTPSRCCLNVEAADAATMASIRDCVLRPCAGRRQQCTGHTGGPGTTV